MAKEKTYKVQRVSPGGVRHDVVGGLTEKEAIAFCEGCEWVIQDDNGFVWDLEFIEEA